MFSTARPPDSKIRAWWLAFPVFWGRGLVLAVVSVAIFTTPALAQEVETRAFVPKPIAGHPVLDFRVGVDRVGAKHPVICAEVAPAGWWSIEGCGTGSGVLHHGNEADMAHFRARLRTAGIDHGRTEVDFLLGLGIAEVQTTADEPGFKFGAPVDANPIEAAGPEASVAAKGRLWLDNGGRTYTSADLSVGVAAIPGAPAVLGQQGPVVPFAALTVGLGF